MSLDIQPAGASFRAIDLNAVHVVGFMTDDGFVLNNDPQSPNTLKLAGGDIQFWGRLVHHQDARLQGQIVVSFTNLQLHEIQQSLSPKAKPESGELSGQFTLIVDPRNLAAASGQGDFRIDHSALVNLVFVNFLFDILHPGQILSPADGKGSVRLVLDNDRIHAITGRYFNNGFGVRADGTIDHVFQGPAAKLDILAVSSGRPLSKVPLPLLPDLDSILAVLQHDLLAEHIGGTIGQPSYKTIPLRDLTQEMLQFLTGDVRRQTESTAD
jgi:hypothetical protein